MGTKRNDKGRKSIAIIGEGLTEYRYIGSANFTNLQFFARDSLEVLTHHLRRRMYGYILRGVKAEDCLSSVPACCMSPS